MDTNATNNTNKLKNVIYPELSYVVTGILFDVHNNLGRYAREKQYGDEIEKRLKDKNIKHSREFRIGDSGNIVDFLIDNKIVLELKAKPIITTDDYCQLQRYLQIADIRLGLLINFRTKYLGPKRVVRIDKFFK